MNKITLLLLIITYHTYSQNGEDDSINQMKEDIMYLSSDKLKGRQTGSQGEKKAAKYIIKAFEKASLIKKGEIGYIQKFKIKPKQNPHSSIKSKEAEKPITWAIGGVPASNF